MTITEKLTIMDSSLIIHKESEWSGSPNSIEYEAFNDGGVECEVGEFLYSLIRLLKPKHVLETGTHFGIGASYMGLALKDNGYGSGYLDTFEFLSHIHEIAVRRIENMSLSSIVFCHLMDVANFVPDVKYQLIFLDTEPHTRFKELLQFYPYLDDGGYIFIHDLPRSMCQGNFNPDHPDDKSWPFGDIPEEMRSLIKEDKLRPFHLPNPRSLVGFYKVHREDYKWRD